MTVYAIQATFGIIANVRSSIYVPMYLIVPGSTPQTQAVVIAKAVTNGRITLVLWHAQK